MQSLATMAASHAVLTSGLSLGTLPQLGWDSLDGIAVGLVLACIGFAAVSTRRMRNCTVPPVGAGSDVPRLSRVRRRVDGMLTGMLSDDADKLTQPAPGRRGPVRPAEVAEQRFGAPSTWRGDYVDALPAGRHLSTHPYPDSFSAGGPAAGKRAKRSDGKPGAAAAGGPPWPWLTSAATVDGERLWPIGDDKASEPEDVERALATATRDRHEAAPPSSLEQRRRDAVQRFLAAPVVDLETAREVLATGNAQALSADEVKAADGGASRDEADARRWSAGPGATPADQAGRAADGQSGAGSDSAEADGEADSKPPGQTADETFWGPRGTAEEEPGSGYRSRDKHDDPAKDKPHDGRRAKPRHAAPPASFGATLTRRLSGTKLTSKSAAHAG